MQVLLVEDDDIIAASVKATLTKAEMSCDHALTTVEAERLARERTFDVIVIDRMLPDHDGIELIGRLRGMGIGKPIMVLSALGRAQHRVEGLDGGADDYLAKPFEPDELIARLRALHRRGALVANQPLWVHGDIELHTKARTVHRAGRHLALSPKEFEILRLLMENSGDVVTRNMLLLKVWNLSFDPQTNVVDVSLKRLRGKLDEGFATSWLETVRGQGYRLRPVDQPV